MVAWRGRLALATATLCFGVGAGGRAEAGTVLNTPAGLTPGQQFRFVFVTDGTTAATSTNITDYNNFVSTQAGGATYNGSVVSWFAIASTSAVSAPSNIGSTSTPLYLADGTQVATSATTSGLFSGSIKNAIDLDLASTIVGPSNVWTGTLSNGTTSSTFCLGTSSNFAGFGSDGSSSASWAFVDQDPTSATFNMYGISQVLTVPGAAVPEPSSWIMAVTAAGAGIARAGFRSRIKER
jgi:hypothetical protein